MKQPCHFEFLFIISASLGMQLLAVNEDHLEDVQEHEEVEMDSTGKLNLKVKNAVETIYDVQYHL